MNSLLSFSGNVTAKKIKAFNFRTWKVHNILRVAFLWGLIQFLVANFVHRFFGIATITSELRAVLKKADGREYDLGVLSRRMVTDAGVAYIVDDWDGGANVIDNFNYHGCGTDDTPGEAVGDTALQLECTTVLNPDSTRPTGTKTQPTANQMRTVGTASFDGSAAVVEHGIFSQAATGGGTLLDRSTFAAINVVNGDSIQFTYTLTLTAGG